MLLQFAMQGEAEAVFVAESINGAKPGFWPIAVKIVERYPDSKRIGNALANGAEHLGNVIVGSSAIHLEKCRKEVEVVLGDGSLSRVARDWLQKLESSLRMRRDQESASEIDQEINGFVQIAGDPNAQARLWAIEVLIHRDKLAELLKVMPKAGLEGVLPSLALSQEEVAEITNKIRSL